MDDTIILEPKIIGIDNPMLTNGLDNPAIVNGFDNEDQVSEDEKVGRSYPDIIVQSQQWKHRKVWNQFKENNKDVRATSNEAALVSLLLIWTYFTHCSGVSIVDFEQVSAGWEYIYGVYLPVYSKVVMA